MKYLSQRDSKWAKVFIGNTKQSLGRVGCTITCLSMISDYFAIFRRPDWIANNLSFTPEALILWDSLSTMGLKLENRFYGHKTKLINDGIKDPEKACILQVAGYHWVVALSTKDNKTYRIVDPWTGTVTTTEKYGNKITGGAVINK